MPHYSLLPAPNSWSVEDAIRAGKRRVSRPARIIVLLGSVLALALPLGTPASWWWLLLFPGSIVASYLYTQIATPAWRIWAYAGVRDIHQFQRCAELEWLLPRRGYMRPFGIMDVRQRHQLEELQKRFAEEMPFEDDPAVPAQTAIASRRMPPFTEGSKSEIVLSAAGITVVGHALVSWNAVQDAHIGTKERARARVDVDWLLGDDADGEWEIGIGSRECFACCARKAFWKCLCRRWRFL